MFNRNPTFETKPGTWVWGEPYTEGTTTYFPFTATFHPIKFPPGIWYYKKTKSENGWVHYTYTRVFPWNDTVWWKYRYRRTLNWIKKHVGA